MNNSLAAAFGNIDIYLFDQLLKGRFDACKNIIDVGCGSGRNMVYFLNNGFNVFGIDQDPNAVAAAKELSERLSPGNPVENFQVAAAEHIPFADATFDLAICSAVLHFADDAAHFDAMLRSVWRVLKPGGFFFARLASDIGIEALVYPAGNGKYLLPDGSLRFLVNRDTLTRYARALDAELYEPVKTTVVDEMRAMTTWCMRKKSLQ